MAATAKLNESARGVYIIAATPFTDVDEVDVDSIDRLVDFYLSCGVDGITALGMMGEAHKLTFEESLTVVTRVLGRVDGRVPVVVGVSNAGFGAVAHLSHYAMDRGAAGVMLAPPAGLRTDDDVYGYFAGAFEALGADVPVCLQDYPQSSGVYISVSVFLRLVADFPQLVVFKHEDWPGLGKLSRVRDESAERGLRRVAILCGNGGLFFPLELRRGADGAMTGFAYPEMLVEVYRRFADGDADGAEDLFDAYLPLVRYEQQPGFGLAVRKALLHRRGVIASPRARAPGPRLTQRDREELDILLKRLDHRLAAERLTAPRATVSAADNVMEESGA